MITNYSMLEYMLCRPQDSCFFGPDLRCIILDEAHLYTGALAAEITMLLRRVIKRCELTSDRILQIATSATLGGTEDDLSDYASRLFSVRKTNTKIIRGRFAPLDLGNRESPPATTAGMAHDLATNADMEFTTLDVENRLIENDEQAVKMLGDIVTAMVSAETVKHGLTAHSGSPARFLQAVLKESPQIRRLAGLLSEEAGHILSINELAGQIFPGEDKQSALGATILILRFAASARENEFDLPLVPHRLHFLVRAPEGLSVCLNPDCPGPDHLKVSRIGCLQPSRRTGNICKYCGSILLPIHRCEDCGEWALAAHENHETSVVEPGYFAPLPKDRTFFLLAKPFDLNLIEVVVEPSKGEIRGFGAAGVSLWKAPSAVRNNSSIQRCPTCQSEWTPSSGDENRPEWKQQCLPLIGGRPFTLSVVAETVLHDLSAFGGESRAWKPAGGRRLLCFSDSRASAARLGPLLTRQHEIQVLRAAVARTVRDLIPSSTAGYLEEEVKRIQKKLRESDIPPQLRSHLEIELEDKKAKLCAARSGTPFSDFARLSRRSR